MSLFAERVLSEWIVAPLDTVMSQRRVNEIKLSHRQAVLTPMTGVWGKELKTHLFNSIY